MYYYGGSYNYAPYPAQQPVAYGNGGGSWLAIILVVFLLLIIVGVIGFGGNRFGGCCHREG